MHSIEFSKEARKTLAKLPANVRSLLLEKIEAVAADPYAQSNNVKSLAGRPEMRLRVGDWRVIYRVLDQQIVLLVIKIGSRGQVYQ